MDEITTDIRKGDVKELLYADFALLQVSWVDGEERYMQWKKAMKEKSLKVNVKKSKDFLHWREHCSNESF